MSSQPDLNTLIAASRVKGGDGAAPKSSQQLGEKGYKKNGDELLVNPTDFTNQVQVRESKKTFRALIIGASIFVFGGVLFAVALFFISGGLGGPVQSKAAEPEQRFLAIWPDAPPVATNQAMTVRVAESEMQMMAGSSRSYSLVLADASFTGSGWTGKATTDFGEAGNMSYGNLDYPIWLFRDIVRSEAFAAARNGAVVEVEGSPAAAMMLLQLPQGWSPVLAIANPDASGFMVVFPINTEFSAVETLAKQLSIAR